MKGNLLVGIEQHGHLDLDMRSWRRQYSADGSAHIEIGYEVGAKDWLKAMAGERESSAKAKLWNAPTVFRRRLGARTRKSL